MKSFEQYLREEVTDNNLKLNTVTDLAKFLQTNASSILKLSISNNELSDAEQKKLMKKNLDAVVLFLENFILRYQPKHDLNNLYFAVFDLDDYAVSEIEPPYSN